MTQANSIQPASYGYTPLYSTPSVCDTQETVWVKQVHPNDNNLTFHILQTQIEEEYDTWEFSVRCLGQWSFFLSDLIVDAIVEDGGIDAAEDILLKAAERLNSFTISLQNGQAQS